MACRYGRLVLRRSINVPPVLQHDAPSCDGATRIGICVAAAHPVHLQCDAGTVPVIPGLLRTRSSDCADSFASCQFPRPAVPVPGFPGPVYPGPAAVPAPVAPAPVAPPDIA